MTEQAALCGTPNGVISLASHLLQEEHRCDVCVHASLYANICVLLGCVLFEYVYMRIWLAWLV